MRALREEESMIQKACMFLLVLVFSCSALLADPGSNRWDVGRLSLEETDDLEYFGEGYLEQQFTYVEVVNYIGCDSVESLARGFVDRVVRDEVQEGEVREFEVGCWARNDGSRVVSVLQTYSGTNVEHQVFLYELGPTDTPGNARKICDFGDFSYDLADLEMTGREGDPALIAFVSHASTGETTLAVWDLSCSKVMGTDLLRYRVVQEEDARGIVTIEFSPLASLAKGSCGRLIRRIASDAEIVEDETCGDPGDAEQLQARMRLLYGTLDLGVETVKR
jgi:hypothetical protein